MKTRYGTCAICGEQRPLTFEHIPPRSAYNDQTVMVLRGEKVLSHLVGQVERGQQQQRGAGDWLTCAECNNKSGRWYVREYAAWVERGVRILALVGGRERQDEQTAARVVRVPFEGVRPLLFLKQIVYMLLAVNPTGFGDVHPDLRQFVLSRDATGLSGSCHFHLGLVWGPGMRHVGTTAKMGLRQGSAWLISEVAFPPFSCVMSVDAPRHGLPLCEITAFARYGPDEVTDVELPLLLGFTHFAFPGDYRSGASIARDRSTNDAISATMESSRSTR